MVRPIKLSSHPMNLRLPVENRETNSCLVTKAVKFSFYMLENNALDVHLHIIVVCIVRRVS